MAPKSFKTSARAGLCVSVCALMIGAASPAHAQLGEQTGIADPGRAGEQFQEQSILPQSNPRVDVKGMQLEGAPPGAENIRFVLRNINFEGMDALSDSAVRSVYAGMLNTEITLAELYGIANGITAQYRNAGYILTRVIVPPQTIADGNVDLQVVEGYIDSVVIQGPEEEGPALNLIRDYAAQIGTGGALNVKALERQLLLINDLPGVSARSIISPSRTPGAADLLIIVERSPWDALLAADNYGSRYLGPIQLTGAATANSHWGLNEAITAQVVVAPDSGYELGYGALSYEQPVGRYGTKVRVLGSKTFTEPGYDLDQFDVQGQSSLLSIQATHPFVRSRSVNFTGRALFDWRDIETKNNIELARSDRLRVVRAGGRVDFIDTLLGVLGVAVNAVDVEFSKGLGILGASEAGRANLTRAMGEPQFHKAEIEIQRFQRLTDQVNLLLVGRGQWADNPLLSSEEFSVGGIHMGRGYDPSEITGDDGIAGKAEIQWNDPYVFEEGLMDTYQVYGFFDAGTVWDQDPTTNADKRDSVTSTGAGVRMSFPADVEADFAVAFPLSRDVQTAQDKDPKFYLGVNKRF